MGCGGSKVYPVSITNIDNDNDNDNHELWDIIVDLYRSLLSERGHKLLKYAITLKIKQNPTSPLMIRAVERSINSHKEFKYPY